MAIICFLSESCDMYILSLSSIRKQMIMLTKLHKNLFGVKVITSYCGLSTLAQYQVGSPLKVLLEKVHSSCNSLILSVILLPVKNTFIKILLPNKYMSDM